MFHHLCDMTECFAIGEEPSTIIEKEPLTDKTAKFVVNADIATDVLRKGGVYMYGNCVLPYVFLACQRCWDKSNFKVVARCFECDSGMLDHGIKFEIDDKQVEYCRMCFDVYTMKARIKKYASERFEALSAIASLSDLTWEDIRTISWDTPEDRGKNLVYRSVQDALTTRQLLRQIKMEEIKQDQDKHDKRMERSLRNIFLRGHTDLTPETITRIQKTLQFDSPPSSVDEILNVMLDHVCCRT